MRTKFDIDKIIELYTKQKLSIEAVAGELHSSAHFVRMTLKENGVETNRYKVNQEKREKITKDWRDGCSVPTLMDKYKISKSGLWHIVRNIRRRGYKRTWKADTPKGQKIRKLNNGLEVMLGCFALEAYADTTLWRRGGRTRKTVI